MARVKWNFEKEIESCKQWISRRDIGKEREKLEKEFRKGQAAFVNGIAGNIEHLGHTKSTMGVVSIAEGNAEGWEEFLLGTRMIALGNSFFWLLQRAGKYGGARGFYLVSIIVTLSGSLAFRQEKHAAWLADDLIDTFEDASLEYQWNASNFIVFMVELASLWRRQRRLERRLPIGAPYAGILENWDKPEELPELFSAVCDNHINQMKKSAALLDFPYRSFSMLPSEIAAIYYVRESLQLPTPPCSHPMASNPVSQVPLAIAKQDDAHLTESLRFISAKFPVLGEII